MALSTDIERSYGELGDRHVGRVCMIVVGKPVAQVRAAVLDPWAKTQGGDLGDEPGRVEVVRKYRQQVSS